MIIVTGAAGFIGSALIGTLQSLNYGEIIAVDDFSKPAKKGNLAGKKIKTFVERDLFLDWLSIHGNEVQFIFHIGARTNTTEQNWETLTYLNIEYPKAIWEKCIEFNIPLVYASSAATYGNGDLGFSDSKDLKFLKPLNLYGKSKHEFDTWVLQQQQTPPFWAGFKFFNVFGPNEYHKERMASVVYHAFNEIKETGSLNLFKSHKENCLDGEQKRDFIYVKDLISVLIYFMENRNTSGIYNLGTGKSRTYNDLATAVFKTLNLKPNINYIDIPNDIRDSYQYFTEAEMEKVKNIGYLNSFMELEYSIKDYIENYLLNKTFI